MLNIAIGKKPIIVIVVVIALCLMSSLVGAQTYLHKVVKGDTLWSICEQYYGDAMLWPKLWQMNPFITNPHLLEAGDLINLLEDRPITTGVKPILKPAEPISGTTSAAIVTSTPTPQPKKQASATVGLDLSGYEDIKDLGYLTLTPVIPWGRINYKTNDKIILTEDELVVVNFFQTEGLKAKQTFVAYRTLVCRHPITDKKIGETVEITGKLTLVKPLGNGLYLMQVTKLFRTIDRADFIIPMEPISLCVLPISADIEITAEIITTKDQKQIIGEGSVVYLAKGFNHGVQRGHLFNIVQTTANVLELSLGKIIIIESRPDTSVGIVLQMAPQESTNGVVIKSIAWDDPLDLIKKLPACRMH